MTTRTRNHLIKQQGTEQVQVDYKVVTAAMISGRNATHPGASIRVRGEAPVPIVAIERDSAPYTLQVLHAMRDQFVMPDYQRNHVWTNADSARYVLMAMYNIDLCKIRCVQYEHADGTIYRGVNDGQQQWTAIMDFMSNKFPLPSEAMLHARNPNSAIPVISPGCYYSLDPKHPNRPVIEPKLKSRFDNYQIDVSTMRNVPPEWEPDIFEMYQQGKPLTLGDRLWARQSDLNTLARRLLSHPFFHEVFELRRELDESATGNIIYTPIAKKDIDGHIVDTGRVRFVTALQMPIVAALPFPGIIKFRKEELMKWASGVHDLDYDLAELYQNTWNMMTDISIVFKGAAMASRTDGILMAQAARYLAEDFACEYSEPGCLVPWYRIQKTVQAYNHASGVRANYSIVAQLQDEWAQKQFWNEQQYVVGQQPGLVRKEQITERFIAELATSGRL